MMKWLVILQAILVGSSTGYIYKDSIDLDELTDIFGLSNCIEGNFL